MGWPGLGSIRSARIHPELKNHLSFSSHRNNELKRFQRYLTFSQYFTYLRKPVMMRIIFGNQYLSPMRLYCEGCLYDEGTSGTENLGIADNPYIKN